MATNFETQECVIFVQSTKIGTHENEAIHSIHLYITWSQFMSKKSEFMNS